MMATRLFSFWPKVNCLLTAIAIVAGSTILDAQTYTQLHCFNSSSKDGNSPLAGLTLDGNTLYGTTGDGGSAYNGIVFSINTDGSAYTVLKSFTNTDGATPVSDLVLNSGVLYGTTQAGGDTFNGTVFRVSTNGSGYKVLKSFSTMNTAYMTNTFGTNTDGAQPRGSLVFDGNSLYGTTYFGGLAGNGTVFKVNPDGSGFAVLKSFSPTFQGTNDVSLNILAHGTNLDGARPMAGLLLAGNTLYGATLYGGTFSNGVVFKMQTDGTNFTVLKYFSGVTPGQAFGTNNDGANPRAALTMIGDTLYGTTVNGGSFGTGTIFKLTTNGTDFAVLKNFSEYNSDGAWPYETLLVDGQTLYGTTVEGGNTNQGVVFKVFTDGSDYTVLKYFNPADGCNSYARLVLSSNKLFGVTGAGGTNNGGVVFSLTVPPQVLVGDGNLGVQSNGFGFNVTGISNQTAVLEVCPDLSLANWQAIQTNTLDGGAVYFDDPQWANYSQRFYRIYSP